MNNTKIDHPTKMYVCLAITYAVSLIISNIIAGKLITFFGIILPAAVIVYPIVYIISDIMTEVYGMKMSMLSIKMNAVMNIFMAIILSITLMLPYPVFWTNQSAMYAIFHSTPRIVVASLIAYYFGDWMNSMVISYMKVKFEGKCFQLRAIASTLAGQAIDTILFISIAFFGVIPTNVLIGMIISQYLFKCSYETLFVPFTTAIVSWWKRKENIDVYDNCESLTDIYKPI